LTKSFSLEFDYYLLEMLEKGGFDIIALYCVNPPDSDSSSEINDLPVGTPQNPVSFANWIGICLRDCLSVFAHYNPPRDGTNFRDYIQVFVLAINHYSFKPISVLLK
jgi:UDP-glucose 4-epimerase